MRLADAIEQTLAEAYPGVSPFRNCFNRAALTHRVLTQISADKWQVQVGSFHAWFADEAPDDQVNAVGWEFEMGMAEGRGLEECHAWVARAWGSMARATEVEIVDSTSRHLPAYARELGWCWRRPVLSVAWTTAAALLQQRYSYRAHPAAAQHFLGRILSGIEDLDLLAEIAMHRIEGRKVFVMPLPSEES